VRRVPTSHSWSLCPIKTRLLLELARKTSDEINFVAPLRLVVLLRADLNYRLLVFVDMLEQYNIKLMWRQQCRMLNRISCSAVELLYLD
jgi:hypothetical protein